MDRLGWFIAKVAHPIHIPRLETSIIRHKSVHLKLVGSISTLHSQTITLSGTGEWPEGTGIDQNFSLESSCVYARSSSGVTGSRKSQAKTPAK